MRTLYLDCGTGASGDMLLGALADLLDDPRELESLIAAAGIPGVTVEMEIAERSAVSGIRVHVKVHGTEEGHEGHQPERHLSDILGLIGGLHVSDRVKADAAAVYRTIAGAESEVHGKAVDEVHFHEVGALDAVTDVVGVCLLIERLAPEQVIASPIRTGFGSVRCAHGILPVPAPATAFLLRGLPVFAGDEEGEFCTPTGAALVGHFAARFEQMPRMVFDDIGCGLGERQYEHANLLRAYLGDADEELPTVTQIDCNIDDMTPEDLGGVIDILMTYGALDATVVPAIMKKGRPGYILSCLCRERDADDLAVAILAHTSTIGLRMHVCRRYEMRSRTEQVRTDFGPVRVKVSEGYGLRKSKPEFEDLKKRAAENDVTIADVRNQARLD